MSSQDTTRAIFRLKISLSLSPSQIVLSNRLMEIDEFQITTQPLHGSEHLVSRVSISSVDKEATNQCSISHPVISLQSLLMHHFHVFFFFFFPFVIDSSKIRIFTSILLVFCCGSETKSWILVCTRLLFPDEERFGQCFVRFQMRI